MKSLMAPAAYQAYGEIIGGRVKTLAWAYEFLLCPQLLAAYPAVINGINRPDKNAKKRNTT